jgi:hypothetical protein
MLSFEQSYMKEERRTLNPSTKRWQFSVVAPFTWEQYADLGAALEALLGEQFVSWAVDDQSSYTLTRVQYNGLLDENDLELDRVADIQAAYQAWEQSY